MLGDAKVLNFGQIAFLINGTIFSYFSGSFEEIGFSNYGEGSH